MQEKELWQKWLDSQTKEERDLLEIHPKYRDKIKDSLNYNKFILRETIVNLLKPAMRCINLIFKGIKNE